MKNKFLILLYIFTFTFAIKGYTTECGKYSFNNDWLLKVGDIPDAQKSQFKDDDWSKVTLPRAFNEDEAFKVSIEQLTDTVMWYRKHFKIENRGNRKVFIEFEGIRQAGDFI